MQFPIAHLTWLLPIIWMGLCLVAPFRDDLSKTSLRQSFEWIEKFHQTYHRLPMHLSEVRAFAYSMEGSFVPYDNFAMRLHYLALTDQDYLVKSFGRDEQENVLMSAVDPALSTLPKAPLNSVMTVTFDQSIPQLYQPILLTGTESPQTGLIASLEVHNEFSTKQLLVRKLNDSGFFLASFHDQVEEFFWLPSGKDIVFTANGSHRYEDGIYFWNLETNSVRNILPDLVKQLWPSAPENQTYYISLSHISQINQLLYILMTPNNSDQLDPKIFYSFKKLLAIPIDEKFQHPAEASIISTDLSYSAFDYPIIQKRLLQPFDKAPNFQKEWLSLSLIGDPEYLIDQWQGFSSKQSGSPILAYSLWWLASIYNDTFRSLEVEGSSQSQVIRNYAIEITDALHDLPTTPSYLRAMANHLKKNLLLSKAADYNVSSLSKNR